MVSAVTLKPMATTSRAPARIGAIPPWGCMLFSLAASDKPAESAPKKATKDGAGKSEGGGK